MPEDKLELELDVNTKEAKGKLDKLANEYTQKKIRIGVDQSEIKKLEQTMVKFQKLIDNPLNVAVKDQLSQNLQGHINKYNELIQSSIRGKEEIKSLRREMSNLFKENQKIDEFKSLNDDIEKTISFFNKFKEEYNKSLTFKNIKKEFNDLASEISNKKIEIKVDQSQITKFNSIIKDLTNSLSNAGIGPDAPIYKDAISLLNELNTNYTKDLSQLKDLQKRFADSLKKDTDTKEARDNIKELSLKLIELKEKYQEGIGANKVKKEFEDLATALSNKKIEIKIEQGQIKELENTLTKLNDAFRKIGVDASSASIYRSGMQQLSEMIRKYSNDLIISKKLQKDFNASLKESEQASNGVSETTNKIGKLKDKLSGLESAGKNVASTLNRSFFSAARSASNASNHVDEFSRRIFRLLRNAFVFNVISRGFRGLSDTLYNLIRRDTQLARSLLIVKANLIRAFAPIWQVVLPWIRALGRALVWLSNRLISFINYLAGREIIKPVKEIGEAQKVVGNFMKIASPKKEMFDLEKPAKKTKELKDNTKKATKETNKLLASFDKLETLKFKKGGFAKDPFGLEELKKDKNGKDILNNGGANLEIKADTESVEQQIARAINQIEDQPLEFKVNDNIGEQITSEVNGLNLPTLDFKVDTDNNKLDDLKLKLNLVKDAIIGIATAATVYRVVSILGSIVGIGASMVGPAGWLSLAVGLGVGLSLAFKDMNKYLKDADGNLTPFGKSIEKIQEKLKPLSDEFKNWKDDVFPKLGDALNDIFKDFQKYLKDNPDFLKDVSEVLALILKLAGFGLWTNLKILRVMLKGVLDVVEAIYLTVKGIWNFIKDILDGLAMTSAHNFIKQKPIPALKGKIPGLAQGSVLNGGDPFLAYLNDQPRGQTNIEAPLSTMVSAFKQALSEGGYNSPTTINLEASGDMSELIRMLNIKISQERIRVGNSFVEGY